MTTYTISSGITSSGLSLHAGDVANVLSGGTISNSSVLAGGVLNLQSGGTATYTYIDGGTLYNNNGTIGIVVIAGGTEYVQGGLVFDNSEVEFGGLQYLISGGKTSGTILTDGTQIITSGTAFNTNVAGSGSTQSVSLSGQSYGTVVEYGGTQIISNTNPGYAAFGTVVSSGSTETVAGGGTTSGSIISSGGLESVLSGGRAVGTTVQSGGRVIASSGGALSATVVNVGGVEILSSGGIATATFLNPGGSIDLTFLPFAGNGTESVVTSGNVLTITDGALHYAQTLGNAQAGAVALSNDGSNGTLVTAATQAVNSGVTIAGLTLSTGNFVVVGGGGAVLNTTIYAGATLNLVGGKSISATVNSGGTARIGSQGVGSNTVVNSGGLETVAGVESASIINLGGMQAVGESGVALGTIVRTGGTQTISGSGSAIGTIVSSGGTQIVSDGYGYAGSTYGAIGGGASSTTLNGGVETIVRLGYSNGVIINSGGLLNVGNNGSSSDIGPFNAANVVINAGGSAFVAIEGSINGVTVETGGVLRVTGDADGAVLSGGTEYIDNGSDHTTVIYTGGVQYVGGPTSLFGDSRASGTTISSGGRESVLSGGTTVGTLIFSGGVETVSSGGTSQQTAVYSGAQEIISSGGIASGTIVYGGGSEIISSGGLAIGTVVYGGSQTVGSGNIASSTAVYSGGVETVLAGGTASGTIVYNGGTENIAAGGVADGTTIQFGVSEVAGAGATVSGAVIEAGGRLVVTSGSAVTNTHLKLGGTIDLPNLAYSDTETVAITAQSIASYLLTVNNGLQTQTLQLGNNPPGTLRLSSDGSGGTAITAVGSLTGNISVDAGALSRAPNTPMTRASIIAAMTQALADWGKYILSDRPLQIQINIGKTTYPTELADDVVTFVPLPDGFSADLGTRLQGITVSQAVAGIASGEAFASPDITITINQADLNSIYFPPDPSGSYQVPAGKIDLVSLFEHEIGHAIGFDGLRNQSGALENAESVFDTWMNVSGSSASLVGPAEQNQFIGQPVPLTTGASNGANNYTLASGSGSSLSNDLMGPSLKPGQRYQISGLDLAAVETAGVPAGLGHYSPVGVNQILAPVHFDSQPAAFTVTPQSDPKLNDIVTWKLPGIINSNASTVYQIQREIWLTTSAYAPNSQGFLFYSKIEPYVDTAAANLSNSGPSLLPASGTYNVTYVLSEQSGSGRYVQEQTINGGTITFQSPASAARTNYTPSQPDEGSDSSGQGDDSGSGENGIGSSTDSSAGQSDPTQPATLPIYRFYDTSLGTHLFTQSQSEAQEILQTRPDLTEEVDNFGAAEQLSPAAVPVYRFFETGNGTHFFTANTDEFLGLTTPGSANYRPDLTYEPNGTLYVDTIQEAGDVAVYRLFDSAHGTQFLTGSQAEYQGLTTPGSSSYRSDLSSEGVAFYAPQGSSFL